jgi:hypothetical protein
MPMMLSWFMTEAYAERLVTAFYFVLTGCVFAFIAVALLR